MSRLIKEITSILTKQAKRKWKRAPEVCDANVWYKMPYTVVQIITNANCHVGVCKCRPEDEWDDLVGFNLAAARACEDVLLSAPTELPEPTPLSDEETTSVNPENSYVYVRK